MNLEQTFQLPGNLSIKVIARDGIQESDMDRLKQAFLFVWSCISSTDKDHISHHWGRRIPILELSDSIFGENIAERQGMAIRFCWKICRLFPNECLQVIIAHELGHVFQGAIGKNRSNITINDLRGFKGGFNDRRPLPLREHGLIEFHADEMAEKWGFDPVLPHAFLCRDFNIDCEGEYVPRKRPRNEKRAHNKAKRIRRDSLYYSWGNSL
jgi:hypothetical protein